MDQEKLIQIQMIQEQTKALEQKKEMIDAQIEEMGAIKSSLDSLGASKSNEKEILSNLGKGIFVKTKIIEDNLYVNTGKNIVVKKSVKDTIGILEDQMIELDKGKQNINDKMNELQQAMLKFVQEAEVGEKKDSSKSKSKK